MYKEYTHTKLDKQIDRSRYTIDLVLDGDVFSLFMNTSTTVGCKPISVLPGSGANS